MIFTRERVLTVSINNLAQYFVQKIKMSKTECGQKYIMHD